MDQNQTVDNDLQKAIDDITNNTNIDPVFSDPIAAPSTVPEDDTGELGDPIGPFANPAEEPSANPPEPPIPPTPISPSPNTATPPQPLNDTSPIATPPTTPSLPDVQPPTKPNPTESPMVDNRPTISPNSSIYPDFPTPPTPPTPATPPMESSSVPSDMKQIKEAALRDLIPLLDHLNMSPSQKFGLYRNIFEDLHDYAVLEHAYRAASEISDETERAEALLYLVETIDKM